MNYFSMSCDQISKNLCPFFKREGKDTAAFYSFLIFNQEILKKAEKIYLEEQFPFRFIVNGTQR